MDSKDLIDVFLTTRNSIYFFCNFYLVGVITIIGWLISLKMKLKWQIKTIASFLFLLFAFLCLCSLRRNYLLLEATKVDFISLASKEIQGLTLYQEINRINYKNLRYMIYGILLVTVPLVVGAIWQLEKWKNMGSTKKDSGPPPNTKFDG